MFKRTALVSGFCSVKRPSHKLILIDTTSSGARRTKCLAQCPSAAVGQIYFKTAYFFVEHISTDKSQPLTPQMFESCGKRSRFFKFIVLYKYQSSFYNVLGDIISSRKYLAFSHENDISTKLKASRFAFKIVLFFIQPNNNNYVKKNSARTSLKFKA